ncbi:granzyme B-like [Scomber japonicus]|uniref:granzyme B-like n=1 Tax=Scomber japonicus TaxID=13676 RepID=UPI0023065D0F|nr:granzyme B-like [Scomber japonicus]
MMHACCIILVIQLLSLSGAMESGIVGGKKAKPHSRPYMASLQVGGNHTCGGILIREDFVLTAAKCRKLQQMTVVLGAHDITKKEKSQQRIDVEYHSHPEFDGYDYDIMLLKLKKKATLNKFVKTIGLPTKDEKIPAKIKCEVAGWGRTATANKDPSHVLKENKEEIQFSPECINKMEKEILNFKPNRMLCTTFTKKKGGICQGDSGGPLICKSELCGIAAFTDSCDCNDPSFPHGFTKVSFFLPWIKEVMKRFGDAE